MLALKILIFLLGTAFLIFGFLIFFRKKYFLINDFESDYKAGRKTEKYARTVGLSEFIFGLALLLTEVILIVFF